jgi:hypothetical protein
MQKYITMDGDLCTPRMRPSNFTFTYSEICLKFYTVLGVHPSRKMWLQWVYKITEKTFKHLLCK